MAHRLGQRAEHAALPGLIFVAIISFFTGIGAVLGRASIGAMCEALIYAILLLLELFRDVR
ncbi:MAG: hypothetical protein K1X74_23295 [Pirellulales bacterium]|nr:hypothetical protein [Pirellulales bacterium]